MERGTYRTTIANFKKHFNNTLGHDTMMRYILTILHVPIDEVVSVAPVYTGPILEYVTSYKVQGKYPVRIFYRKNQRQILEHQENHFPKNDEIFVWLIRDEEGRYDTGFVQIKLGITVARDFKSQQLTEGDINGIVKEAIGNAGILHIIEQRKIDERVHGALGQALLVVSMLEDLGSDPIAKEVFKSDPSAYVLLRAMGFAASSIQSWKLPDRYWNPKEKGYFPISGHDPIENAFVCGLINGTIEELAGIAEAVAFLTTIIHSDTAYQEFKDSIQKLLEEENIVQLLLEGALSGYIESETPEEFAYNLGKDTIQIISFIIGIFQLAKGVASFVSFVKRAVIYLKRFGREGIDNLKKLNNKQIKEIFESDFIKKLDGDSGIFGGKKLSKIDLDDWTKRLEKDFGTNVKKIDSFNEPNVLAQFDPNTNTIEYVDGVTEYLIAHESYHAEEMFKIGFDNYVKDAPLKGTKFPKGYTDNELLRSYRREKYVRDQIIQNAEKHNLNNEELWHNIAQLDFHYTINLERRGLEIPK